MLPGSVTQPNGTRQLTSCCPLTEPNHSSSPPPPSHSPHSYLNFLRGLVQTFFDQRAQVLDNMSPTARGVLLHLNVDLLLYLNEAVVAHGMHVVAGFVRQPLCLALGTPRAFEVRPGLLGRARIARPLLASDLGDQLSLMHAERVPAGGDLSIEIERGTSRRLLSDAGLRDHQRSWRRTSGLRDHGGSNCLRRHLRLRRTRRITYRLYQRL